MFEIPLPVMENAQPRLSKTIDNCFSLNHVCMFEKSPKPLCLSYFLQLVSNGSQRRAWFFLNLQKDTGRDTILILVYIHTYPVFARRINIVQRMRAK